MSLVADMAPAAGAVSVSSASSHWQPLQSYQDYTVRTQHSTGLTIPTKRINGYHVQEQGGVVSTHKISAPLLPVRFSVTGWTRVRGGAPAFSGWRFF